LPEAKGKKASFSRTDHRAPLYEVPMPSPYNPLIVQGDHTILLEVDNPLYEEARNALARFAELVKSPEHVHTYRLTPLSIWNACAIGENPDKLQVVRKLLKRHANEPVLIIGMYIEQISGFAKELGIPIIKGSTPQAKRDTLFDAFRSGMLPALIVSKVANFSIDLPDASVAIQISGMFGSRQEEAQRLGRILRPKPGANQAHFYSLVSHDTVEQDFAMNRQLFLCEQGYEYHIVNPGDPEVPL
jgi:superfamily II DNA or RNA helicase